MDRPNAGCRVYGLRPGLVNGTFASSRSDGFPGGDAGCRGYTSGQVVQIEQGDGVQVVEVDARSDLCSLEVAPVDADGNDLEFFSIVNFRSSAIDDRIFSTATISDGRPFRIPNFPAGRITFLVDAPGHARTAVEVDVNPGEVRRLRPVLASKP
jgi:hypothetical protein